MTAEKSPVESVSVTEKDQHKCSTCRHSIPSLMGARVWCFVTDEQLNPKDSCCRWQVRPA